MKTETIKRIEALEQKRRNVQGVALLMPDGDKWSISNGAAKRIFSSEDSALRFIDSHMNAGTPVIHWDI